MLPPGHYEAAYKAVAAAVAEGREDPESTNDATTIPLSQFVRVLKTLETINDPARVLGHYRIDPTEWARARRAWLPLLYVVELKARYDYWHSRIDVAPDVERLRG
jgi:hypothetical protein